MILPNKCGHACKHPRSSLERLTEVADIYVQVVIHVQNRNASAKIATPALHIILPVSGSFVFRMHRDFHMIKILNFTAKLTKTQSRERSKMTQKEKMFEFIDQVKY